MKVYELQIDDHRELGGRMGTERVTPLLRELFKTKEKAIAAGKKQIGKRKWWPKKYKYIDESNPPPLSTAKDWKGETLDLGDIGIRIVHKEVK